MGSTQLRKARCTQIEGFVFFLISEVQIAATQICVHAGLNLQFKAIESLAGPTLLTQVKIRMTSSLLAILVTKEY